MDFMDMKYRQSRKSEISQSFPTALYFSAMWQTVTTILLDNINLVQHDTCNTYSRTDRTAVLLGHRASTQKEEVDQGQKQISGLALADHDKLSAGEYHAYQKDKT